MAIATIREIAEQAQVSIATVSKVLSDKPGVKRETRELVLRIAKDLNYRPNLNARHLKIGQSRTLGIITEDLTVFNAPEIVDGIDVTLEKHGYHYILGNLRFNKKYGHSPADTEECAEAIHDMVESMLAKQVDGIIYIGCHSHVVVPLSDHREIPFVCAYCISADAAIPSIVYDDRMAAYEITELFIRAGHGCIGVIAGPGDSVHTANRLRGFQEALYHHDILYNPQLTRFGDWSRDSGHACAEELIGSGVTAIFAQNDLMAMGVLDCLADRNILAGRDISLAGFDNREVSTISRPQLTTAALPLFEIGEQAALSMLRILEGGREDCPPVLQLPCTIIERESTCAMKPR